MHLGDSIFIFIMALVLFGPKKLPEMAKQIGKLMAEFRRASNDFKLQIDEELRTMEQQERQKKQEAERAALAAPAAATLADGTLATGTESTILPATTSELGSGAPPILPPSVGEQVSAGSPYAVSAPESASHTESASAEDHPLLQVAQIPVDPHMPDVATGLAAAEANAATLAPNYASSAPEIMTVTSTATTPESEQAPTHHG